VDHGRREGRTTDALGRARTVRVAAHPALGVLLLDGYQGTLPAGAPYPDGFLLPDSFVTVSTDELDVPRLAAHRVMRR